MAALPEIMELDPDPRGELMREPVRIVVLTTAELAECTCPEFCERDHDNE